jgi:hypothetical protein
MNEGLLQAIYIVQTEAQIREGMLIRKGAYEGSIMSPEPVSISEG